MITRLGEICLKKIISSLFIFFLTLSLIEINDASAAEIFWTVPQSQRVTQEFKKGTHDGIDIGAATAGVEGNRIVAMHNGKVSRSGWSDSYGYVVYIDHQGTNHINYENIQSRYAHLQKTPSVSTGQNVNGGATIGYMGNTGHSFGVHLHFETRKCLTNPCSTANGSSDPVNPMNYYKGFLPTRVVESASAYEAMLEISEFSSYEEIDIEEEGNFYSIEELKAMTPEERMEIGYPNPYEVFE